jgi:ribosomal protein S18 acetylase RimI-like enzyme
MSLMQALDARELYPEMDRIKSLGRGYLTNLYASRSDLEGWLRVGALSRFIADECLLLFRFDRGLLRVYHAATGRNGLAAALAAAGPALDPGLPLLVDLVGRAADLEGLATEYRARGFDDYCTLLRMARPRKGAAVGAEPTVETATPADLEKVDGFLHRVLDPFRDQIPTIREIAEAIDGKTVLLTRRERRIAGLLYFDQVGRSAHLRFWYVAPERSAPGTGGPLMREFLRRCDAADRIVVWVASTNAGAIEKYEHYGFRPDAIVDRILIRRSEQL